MTSALLVIDMQRDYVATCPAALDVLTVINKLIAVARRTATTLVFVQDHGDELPIGADGWQLDPRLDHRDGDTLVAKTFRDAFAGTALTGLLRHAGVDRIVVTGVHSDYCVQTTAMSALAHGLDVVLVADGHAAEDALVGGRHLDAAVVTEFVNSRMATLRYPGRRVETLPASAVSFD